jgi:hypothetical protein
LRKFVEFSGIEKPGDITNDRIRAFRVHLAEKGGLKKKHPRVLRHSHKELPKYLVKGISPL